MTVRIATTSLRTGLAMTGSFAKGAVQVRQSLVCVGDDVGIVPYGWYAGCENRARSCSVPGEVSLLCFYRSHSGRARFWMPETIPMAANKVTMEVPP